MYHNEHDANLGAWRCVGRRAVVAKRAWVGAQRLVFMLALLPVVLACFKLV